MKEIIFQNQTKERLDKFLTTELADLSRSKIQTMIKDEQILVNNKTTAVHHWLKKDDKIVILEEKSKKEKTINKNILNPLQNKQITKSKEQLIPKIIEETADYLIINKPAGLIVHPAKSVKEKTLTDWLVNKYPKIKTIGEDKNRPGIVHRLDKEVSGIMVIAKTQKIFEHLKKQFQDHTIIKEYLGLVQGNIEADEGIIDFPLKRSKLTGKIVAKPKSEEGSPRFEVEAGREAITKFNVLKRFVNYTYLKIGLETGRTHQIRAHLQAYGCPLVGDKLYKNKKTKEKIDLDRIFLHSHILEFIDLDNESQKYQSPLPDKLNQILNEIT